MFPITNKKNLARGICALEILAPEIARSAKPGQFLMLKIDEKGERIPLTIADIDKPKNTIKIIFQAAGKTTEKLCALKKSDALLDLLGPLGKKTELKYYGKILAIGGGVGIAELYPVVKSFKESGNSIYTILGARTKSMLILEEELKKFSNLLYVATNDGSSGKKGFVTDVLRQVLEKGLGPDLVYSIGPTLMMKKVSEITRQYNIKTIVSLNPIMVDATGMCGSCRVSVGGKVKFACVDGPEFDAHEVDFDELINRQKFFLPQEKHSHKHR